MFLNGQVADAETYAKQALTLKPDYSDALIFLSQVSKSQGDNADALTYAEQALSLDPTNKNLSDYVNSLSNPAALSAPVSAPTTTPTKTKK